MNTNELMERLALADPARDPRGEWATDPVDATALKERILASPADGSSPDRVGRKRPARRRILVGVPAAAAIAVVLAIGGVVLRPTQVAGPAPATASEVLTTASQTALSRTDLQPTGDQRIYTAVLSHDLARSDGPWASLDYVGETWTAADGSLLSRKTTLSPAAAQIFGYAVGARPTPTPGSDDTADTETRDPALELPPLDNPLTRAQLAAIPLDPPGLEAFVAGQVDQEIRNNGTTVAAADREYGVVNRLVGLLVNPQASPALRSAVYAQLSRTQDVSYGGPDVDLLQRRGIRIDWTDPSPATSTPLLDSFAGGIIAESILFDPVSTDLLQITKRYSDAAVRGQSPASTVIPPEALQGVRVFFGPAVVAGERQLPPGSPDFATFRLPTSPPTTS